MAFKLLQSTEKTAAFGKNEGKDRLTAQRMRRDFQLRFSALLLALLTMAAVIFAGINYWKEAQNPIADDGAWWVETSIVQAQSVAQGSPADKAGIQTGDRILTVNGQQIATVDELKAVLDHSAAGSSVTYRLARNGAKHETTTIVVAPTQSSNGAAPNTLQAGGVAWTGKFRLRAQRIVPGGPADKAGIKVGDLLLTINNQTLRSSADLNRQLYKAGTWRNADYELERVGIHLETPVGVILAPADRSLNQGLRLIALTYLGIGVYVLLRRWTAPKSTHFYLFCLVSFVFYSFKYTGKLNTFDEIIYWSNVVAWLLQPALFLHFALTFPKHREFIRSRPWLLVMVYAPAVLLLGL